MGVHYLLPSITDTLHEHLCTLSTVRFWIILGMRNVSDNIVQKNRNTDFIFKNIRPTIAKFMRFYGKISWKQTGQT
jgi:hypothetical protein